MLQLTRHEFHVWSDVIEKSFVPGAQVIQSVFAIRRFDKPVLGTLAMASELDFTSQTVGRQSCLFVLTKCSLLLRID